MLANKITIASIRVRRFFRQGRWWCWHRITGGCCRHLMGTAVYRCRMLYPAGTRGYYTATRAAYVCCKCARITDFDGKSIPKGWKLRVEGEQDASRG